MSAPHPGDLYARYSECLSELRALYPDLFAGPFISCSWPIGWHRLVREASAHLHLHAPHVRWSQIKEKFGQLSLYYTARIPDPGPLFHDRIQSLEAESGRTCVLCGGQGDLKDGSPVAELRKFSGWWLTSCAQCAPLITAHRAMRWTGGDE